MADRGGARWRQTSRWRRFPRFQLNERDPTVFKIVLQARNPQAVRRSGGLHEICIRAPAKSEADEYVKHLSALVNVPMA